MAACLSTLHSLGPKPHSFLKTVKNKTMAKTIQFDEVHSHCAGIDIGAAHIFVSPDGEEVRSFETFTAGYRQCIAYLQSKEVLSVAMEATGVYWMALYAMLEDSGIKVALVNPKETKQVKGRKTDVADCRWIQKLFSAGLLRSSFIPEGGMMELRHLVRERLDIIEMGSTYVNKMQKYLELMNIKLKQVISQIHGSSGIRIIKAILEGERDSDKLLALCDERIIKNKSEAVLKALEGSYNETWLFMLSQNMQMWEEHQKQVSILDERIGKMLEQINEQGENADKAGSAEKSGKAKRCRHHEPAIKDLHGKMVQVYGMNLSTIPGFNDYTLLRLAGETGTDMSRFPSVKHFVSWCGLSPKHHKSGKISKRVKGVACNGAGQIFKLCAQSLMVSKFNAVGSFIRKLKAKKDAGTAIKAGARKLAAAYYNALTKGTEYVDQGIKLYEEQIKHRELRALQKLAFKHNFQLLANHCAT
jgi:transposase